MGTHLTPEGRFQSDKYPNTPAGKVPLSTRDPMAQELLWEYARRRRSVDAEFSDDLEQALRLDGYEPTIVVARDRTALYFGCWNEAGHWLHDASGHHIYKARDKYPGFPWADDFLDGGLLRNGKIPDQETGHVIWTCGGEPLWIALVWWDRSGDKQGNSTSGFYVSGFHYTEAAPCPRVCHGEVPARHGAAATPARVDRDKEAIAHGTDPD